MQVTRFQIKKVQRGTRAHHQVLLLPPMAQTFGGQKGPHGPGDAVAAMPRVVVGDYGDLPFDGWLGELAVETVLSCWLVLSLFCFFAIYQ